MVALHFPANGRAETLVRAGPPRPVRQEGCSHAIEAAMPARALGIDAQLKNAFGFGIAKRLVLTVGPSPAPEGPNIAGQLLLKVDAEPVFDRPLLAGGDDIGGLRWVREVNVNRLAIIAHIAVVDVVEQTNCRVFIFQKLVAQL